MEHSASLRTPDDFVRPRTRSPSHRLKITVQNRRRAWLSKHPEYLQSTEHELANPLLYDKLIRQYQTQSERDAEGKAKGYGRVLESSLIRGETRLEKMAVSSLAENGEWRNGVSQIANGHQDLSSATDLEPRSKKEAQEQWLDFVRERFIHGKDEDFEYATVDQDDDLDREERQDEQDEWFDDEEPEWVDDADPGTGSSRQKLEGETGIQDY